MQPVPENDRYRVAANEARAYVKAHLFFGASNDTDFYMNASLMGAFGNVWMGVGLTSHVASQVVILGSSWKEGKAAQAAGRPYQKGSRRMMKAMMEIWSREGLRYHCGNCGVQSAVAFIRLRDYWKVFPLDWVQVRNGDHGFVVIGRDARTDPSNPALWNDEAMVCDPWRNVVQTAKTYAASGGALLELMYRQESATDIPRD